MKAGMIFAMSLSVVATMAGARASASVVDWTYTVNSSVYASGQMNLSGPNGVFGDSVTAISGTLDGQQITGLVTNPNSPSYTYNSSGFVPYDDNIDPTTSSLDYYGIEFDVGNNEYNIASVNSPIFSYTGSGTSSSIYTSGNVFVNSGVLAIYAPPLDSGGQLLSNGDPAIAAPEPASWALTLFGSAGLGLALRDTRRKGLANG